MVFPVVMCGCESWTIKKAEHWRTNAFELLCWRRLLRVPWTEWRSNTSIWKSRDITLPTKVHLVKAIVFLVVIYVCQCWTIKKAEHQRIDAFELWCWRRLLKVPWSVRKSNQSIPKEISPECSLEGPMLKLKLQSFGHLMRSTDSFGKDPDAGKDWRWKEKGRTEDELVGWHHRLNEHEFE